MTMNSKNKVKRVDYEIAILDLAEVYGWSYEEIENTPDWFLSLALQKLNIDNKLKDEKNWN